MEKKVSKLINDQINKEMYSAYLYLDFANHFTEKGLDGFANWYNIQAKEEMDHALKFIAYLHDNDEKVTYEAIAKPESKSKEDIDFKILKQAILSTARKRDSIAFLQETYEIINDIKEDEYLKKLWEVYLRDNPYIGNLSFFAVVEVVDLISKKVDI